MFVIRCVSQPYGPSMLPTLNLTGDLVLVERVSPRLGKVGRGDMVLLRSTEDPRKVVIKRIVGVEGDTVSYLVDPKNSDASRTCVVLVTGFLDLFVSSFGLDSGILLELVSDVCSVLRGICCWLGLYDAS